MEIFKKQPIDALWEITKSLMFSGNNRELANGIKIYKEHMHEDENSIPNSYILLRSQLSDTTELFGDGKSLIRSADCDIILVTKGYADDSTDLHNVNKNKIRTLLKQKEINYQEFNLGYDEGLKSTQHTFSLEVKYLA